MESVAKVQTLSTGKKAKAALLCLMMTLLLTLIMVPSALATQIRTPVGTGSGTTSSPYIVSVSSAADFVAPSAFWSGTGVSSSSNSVGNFVVKFQNSNNNSYMLFDLINNKNTGNALNRGPLYGSEGTSYGTPGSYVPVLVTPSAATIADVWDGTWTYAFRLCPYTTYYSNNGTYMVAFNWKGSFYTYFNQWTYGLDVAALTGISASSLSAGSVTLTYCGDYDINQTSRGTDYTADFTATTNTTDNVYYTTNGESYYSGTTATPRNTDYSTYTTDINSDGVAVFSGNNSIKFGGNYIVSVTLPS